MGRESKTAIDLYCGCGGISVGAEMAMPDLRVAYGLDWDTHACSTFAHNHPNAVVDCRPVSQVTATSIIERAKLDRLDYLFAGPTCQAVSTMGVFYAGDPRNELFVHFARLLKELKANGRAPRRVVLENVPGVVYGGNIRIVRDLFEFLEGEGYSVFADVLNLAALGVPQLRYRFFLVATLDDVPHTFPAPRYAEEGSDGIEPYATVSDAISDLFETPLSETGSPLRYPRPPQTGLQAELRGGSVALMNHWAAKTQEVNLRRVAAVPQGGSWKDIPADLLPDRFHHVRMTDYSTLYGRLHEQNPAYTISASFANVTSGCFTHPREDRPLTVREGARLQGFPDWFEVRGPRNAQYRQIGNAVPPLGMSAVINHLENGGPGVEARITSAALRAGRKLPVLAPRFKAKKSDSPNATSGYGGATFWPVGWGDSPDALPKNESNYRKSTEPLRYRRRDEWRQRRKTTDMNAYVALAEEMKLPSDMPLMGRLGVRPLAAAAQASGDGDLFDRIGAQLLAIAAASPGHVYMQVPFANLAERLHLLVAAYVKRHPRTFRLLPPLGSDQAQTGREGRKSIQVGTADPPSRNLALLVQLDLHTVEGEPRHGELDWASLRFGEMPVTGLTVAAE
jgi:DNA-cytosine methyltransferase